MRELTKNEKLLLIILGLVVVLWVSYQYIITPQTKKIAAFSEQKIEYEDMIDEHNIILSKKGQVDEDEKILGKEQNKIASDYFPKIDQAQIIYLLNKLLETDELKVIEMDFTRPSEEDFEDFKIKQMNVSIPYEGSYYGIVEIMANLSNGPRKIVFDSMLMEREEGGLLKGNISLNIYTMDPLVDRNEEVIYVPVKKRDLLSNPFSPYGGYIEDYLGGIHIPGANQTHLNTNFTLGFNQEGGFTTDGVSLKEPNPYSPEFSLYPEKEKELTSPSQVLNK